MMLARLSVAAVLASLVAVTSAQAKGKLFYEDTLPATGAGAVSVTVRAPAAFRVVLRTSTQGRTRLYLLGKTAPKGGPLIDTKTYGCQGAAGSFYCQGSYEALPKGTYTFRLKRDGAGPVHVELTVRW
jgi:hypothetical protein